MTISICNFFSVIPLKSSHLIRGSVLYPDCRYQRSGGRSELWIFAATERRVFNIDKELYNARLFRTQAWSCARNRTQGANLNWRLCKVLSLSVGKWLLQWDFRVWQLIFFVMPLLWCMTHIDKRVYRILSYVNSRIRIRMNYLWSSDSYEVMPLNVKKLEWHNYPGNLNSARCTHDFLEKHLN